MGRAVWILCLVVACYAPTPPEGSACAANGACPSELACIGGVCVRKTATSPDASYDAPADATEMCPASYAAVTGQISRYRTVTMAQTWTAAEADCEDDGIGTHLAVVDTVAEDAAVDALTGASIWFGLTDTKVEGTTRWVTGATPIYTNYGGAPNTANYDCAGIYRSKWAWGLCTTLIPYVCECDGMAAQPTAY